MKTLTIASAIFVLSSSILTTFTAVAEENNSYIKAGGFGNRGNCDTTPLLAKAEYGYGGTVAAGYQLMDNVRTELSLSYIYGLAYKGAIEDSIQIDGGNAMLNTYVDVINLGFANIYVGGGLGVSYIGAKVQDNATTIEYNRKLNFAGELTSGIECELVEGMYIDLGYKLQNIGTPGNQNDTPGLQSWIASPFIHNVTLSVRFSL